ncbi:ArsR/SmtB family transcription factor [Nocardia sp. NPDC052566]|uniref:ArsR/SmtB family transcription factor n=1 Tax=Nocardia sp. NPDC052566 TaxID=3364330 RepID=UPI0037C670D2
MTETKEAVVETSNPVAPLPVVLGALQDPIRLEMVRRLSNSGTAMRCSALYEVINKSTATHHFKILREAGVIERLTIDGLIHLRLRADAMDTALPGVLPAIIEAANRSYHP